ncbi:hypothetical protein EDM56_28905 [Brevibacillus fluminis]|uniref:DUF2798 domain-containing protein n=1 Tax=Brevibacillus fluminis TaxID=511487 RepID=A0A3M8CWE1_9BACL|nr:hypothetical protein [Brevibacillus fluminis]RNB79547.1 hypothetical protein EDM56_28905 [Brevibacillus fluminis]
MSFYGMVTAYMNHGLPTESLVRSYGLTFLKNFVFAFPLQLIVMGSIIRFVFVKFVKPSLSLKTA